MYVTLLIQLPYKGEISMREKLISGFIILILLIMAMLLRLLGISDLGFLIYAVVSIVIIALLFKLTRKS